MNMMGGERGNRPPRSSTVEIDRRYPDYRRMEPADSIGRLGFARWYERRLIEGHAWFISAFICIVAIAACAEELTFRGSFGRLLLYVTVIAAAAAICGYGL